MQQNHKSLRDLLSTAGAPQGGGAAGWLAACLAGAGALAGSALFNRSANRRAEEETPPAGTFVEVDGVRLHYVERGAEHGGPPVVLLHGNGMMLQDMEVSGVLGLAALRHRVIAFDRPGFGYSERPSSTSWTPEAQARLIAAALQQMGVGPSIVLGHSWGTMVALAMALDRPAAVSGLVLVSGYYYPTARPDVVPFSVPAIPLLGGLLAHTLAPLTGRLIGPAAIKASFSPAPVPEKFDAFPMAMTLRPGQVQATATDTSMMIGGANRLSQRYGELAVPIALLAGDGDRITFPDKHAERLASEVPAARLRIVPGQGHMLHYAVPDQVVEAIDSLEA